MAASLLLLAACAGPEEAPMRAPATEAFATFLTDDLVQVTWAPAEGGRAAADCAMAEAVALRGGGHARHVRTTLADRGGVVHANAVYTVSSAAPAGGPAIDTAALAASCRPGG